METGRGAPLAGALKPRRGGGAGAGHLDAGEHHGRSEQRRGGGGRGAEPGAGGAPQTRQEGDRAGTQRALRVGGRRVRGRCPPEPTTRRDPPPGPGPPHAPRTVLARRQESAKSAKVNILKPASWSPPPPALLPPTPAFQGPPGWPRSLGGLGRPRRAAFGLSLVTGAGAVRGHVRERSRRSCSVWGWPRAPPWGSVPAWPPGSDAAGRASG